MGTLESQRQQLSHNTSDHHSTERAFGVFNQTEHKDQVHNVQQLLENTTEHPFGDGQGGGGGQSGGPRGKPCVLVYTIIYNDHH